MTGLDYTHAEPVPHRCDLPPIRTWDEGATERGEDVFATVREIPTGTRFTCGDCDRVWVVIMVPEMVTQTMVMVAHRKWMPETRQQRRERLRLRWWQREPR